LHPLLAHGRPKARKFTSIKYRVWLPLYVPENTVERKHILEAFRAGHYPAIVTSKVLNEGIDVPEAKIAIVLGGTSSSREYIQRLGRILRKTGNRQAVLYEVIARNTVDEGRSQRRQPKDGVL